MEPLATVEDLEAYGFDTSDQALVGALLSAVSAAVREAAGTAISVVDTTVSIPGTQEQFLKLPGAPVREVREVKIDGTGVTDWKLRGNRLWRPSGWYGQHCDVEVEFAFGLDPVPADIVKLVAMFVGVGLSAAASDEGLVRDRAMAYESIDDYRYGLRQGDDEIVDQTELPERVKRSLHARFSGAASVTGVF